MICPGQSAQGNDLLKEEYLHFGHAGEEAISQWFQSDKGEYLADLDELYKRDIRSFDGNAQGFRMLTQTENFLYDGGLRLTYATLATFMKYPWSTRTITYGDKFGVFLTEENVLDDIANKVGLVARGEHRWCRHPLAYLVEAADDLQRVVQIQEHGADAIRPHWPDAVGQQQPACGRL